MNDREFEDRVDRLFEALEDQIDELDDTEICTDIDVDVDSTAGMLAVSLGTGGSVILSRQIANHEIWVAAKSGGFHLGYQAAQWQCETTGENLGILLNRVFTEQIGARVDVF